MPRSNARGKHPSREVAEARSKRRRPPYSAPEDGWRWRWYRVREAHGWPSKVMEATGDQWCGTGQPPGTQSRLDVPMEGSDHSSDVHVYRIVNDGFSLYMGYPNEWKWHVNRREAKGLAWFVLWTWWGRGEWFGLRRWLYYRALHKHVGRFTKPAGKAGDQS